MSQVEGAVVVPRPGLIATNDSIWPVNDLDFVKTLQSYFLIFNTSLFGRYDVRVVAAVPRRASIRDFIKSTIKIVCRCFTV